jgi:hypothetical protein
MYKFIFIIYLFASFLLASKFAIYSEIGSYNKSYIDERIVEGYNKDALSSGMYTIGGYYQGDFDIYDTIWGVGIVQSKIDYSSVSLDLIESIKLIEQPEAIITIPYIFIGLNKVYWSFEIGVSFYFNIEKFKSRSYLNGELVENGGWDINRFKSHTFVNFKLRFLKEDNFHLELLVARDKFSPVDSLLRFNLVLPLKNIILNTDISLFMPANYFTESDVILKSNQKFTIGIDYKILNFNIGANLGILIKNSVGGDTINSFFSRLSLGLNTSFSF